VRHRAEYVSIPSELLRTLVVILDTGGFTKAAAKLRITQAAVSAHVRRLERFVGDAIFQKSGPALRLTPKGEIVARYARRMVALNDQILQLGGGSADPRNIRISLPPGIDEEVAEDLFKTVTAEWGGGVHFRCDEQHERVQSLEAGHIDLTYCVDHAPVTGTVISEWSESLHWIKSPGFVLAPKAPLPLVSWPGGWGDRLAVRTLERSGTNYSIAFTSRDRGMRKAAVRAGVGVMIAAEHSVAAAKLNVGRDYYLPALPRINAGFYAREGFEADRAAKLIEILERFFKPRNAPA
jgi:DNA-binding transcriptional LysR family regulator